MKRSAALTPLSHDHHRALFVALQLKRAEDGSAVGVLLEFLEAEGGTHFAIEESILLPGWLAADPGADREAAARVLTEHLALRAAGLRATASQPSAAELNELGELLEGHVRFEERELFPAIEAGLDEAALSELGARIAAAEAGC
jgi:hemerythrin-like domain-containing protein